MAKWLMESWRMLAPDGGAGDGGNAGDGAESSTVVNEVDDAPKEPRYPTKQRIGDTRSDVEYGIQPEEAEEPQPAEAAQNAAPEPSAESWEDIRNGKYKKEFDADVQKIVQSRLKNSKEAEAKLAKLGPALDLLGQKFGVEKDDIDQLVAKLTDDDSLYEDEALERGMSVDALKQLKGLERENAAMKAQQQQSVEQAMFEQHFAKLQQQAEQVRQLFPGFDLQTELQNETFLRLTSPNCGIDVMTAYKLVHDAEITPAAMQVAQQKTMEMVTNKLQSGKRRPAENGTRTGSGV